MSANLSWEVLEPASTHAAGRRFMWGIAARSFAWASVICSLALAILFAIGPAVNIPLADLVPALLGLPGLFLLAPLLVSRSRAVRCRLDDAGLRVNARMVCRWRHAIGFSYVAEPEPLLLIVARRGMPVRAPLPAEPLRAEILALVRGHLVPLSPATIATYQVSVAFSWGEVAVFTGLAFANGVLLGRTAPMLLRQLPVPLFFAALISLSLPPAVAAAWRTRKRFGQFRDLPIYVFVLATLFTFQLVAIFAVAFTVAAHGWLDSAA